MSMAKFSELGRYILRVIQRSTCSTLGEYDSRPPLARYVWYLTWYLRSSCCSETHVHLGLSTLDVTHMKKSTGPSPLFRTASDEKLGVGLGTRLDRMYKCIYTVGLQTRRAGLFIDQKSGALILRPGLQVWYLVLSGRGRGREGCIPDVA